PRPVAVSAVTDACPTGAGKAASVQVAPPSDELAANGSCWPAVVTAVPAATTVRPLLATCCTTARAAPTGRGRLCWVQASPPPVAVQAAGASPSEPTATNPGAAAVTASICRLGPGPSSAPAAPSPARCQPARPADHQAAATVRPAVTW